MRRIDINAIGRTEVARRHPGLRSVASAVAALAGGLAVMVAAFVAIGGAASAAAWIAIALLTAIWLTGLWWRWDSPDRRRPEFERERRGF